MKFGFLRDGLPPLSIIALVINWENLDIDFLNLLSGIVVLFGGLYIINNLHMISGIFAFWTGRSSSIQGMMHEFSFGVNSAVPMEVAPHLFQRVFVYLLPIGFASGVSTSVALGLVSFSSILSPFLFGILGFELLKQLLWNRGLSAYNSASS